jgi:ATP-dependent Lon protease
LERELAGIFRKIARKVAKDDDKTAVAVNAESLNSFLGVHKFELNECEVKDQIGIVQGLTWTGFGGEIQPVEVSVVPGKGKVIITGNLGEVLQESAQAALSYIRSRANDLGLETDFYQKFDIHIHLPEGAQPKEGPSAGIALATCIASAFIKVPVRCEIAMTGEITLRGRVLPIGGLKEKLLAAHRAGIKTVLIPKANEKDIAEVHKNIVESLNLIFVGHMDEVIKLALVGGENILNRKPTPPDQEGRFEDQPPAQPDLAGSEVRTTLTN